MYKHNAEYAEYLLTQPQIWDIIFFKLRVTLEKIEFFPYAGSSARPALGAMQELIPDFIWVLLQNGFKIHIFWQAKKSDQLV